MQHKAVSELIALLRIVLRSFLCLFWSNLTANLLMFKHALILANKQSFHCVETEWI